eukprot:10407926-Heterocapsa_arctica.AAC.1
MDGGAALHAKPEALTSTRSSVLHTRTTDGNTRTVIIRIKTAMETTLATRNEKKLRPSEKGRIER